MIDKDSEIIDINEGDIRNNREEVFELIHTTSHSLVYRMRRDGKYFLVKQSAIPDEKGRKILRREYDISIGLFHPNIVGVYEYRFDDNFHDSIIMEYVEGRTLSDFISEMPSLKTKKRIFTELLEAIDYLHQNRIIHNDIKPENIIISTVGDRLKLIDLGLSDNDTHYALKSIGFTRGYSAPELIEKGRSDIRSDIYSLGVIERLLFGRKYSSIYRKCTKTDPEKRFRNVAEIKRKWERLYRRLLIPLIILIVLAAALIVFLLMQERENQNKEREILRNELSDQSRELTEQKASFAVLQDKYNSLNDSIKTAERVKKEKEAKKEEALDKFRSNLQRITTPAMDSMRTASSFQDLSVIHQNYSQKARQFYENQNKIVETEDLSSQFYSILITEMSKVDKEYEQMLKKNMPNY